MKHLFILLLAFVIGSCDDFFYQPADDEKLIDFTERVVVNSILQGDADTIYVQAVWMRPLNDTLPEWDRTFLPVENATVTLSNGSKQVTLPYLSDRKVYGIPQSEFLLQGGTTYYLEVKAGKHLLKASCQMPMPNTSLQARLIQKDGPITMPYKILFLNASWETIETVKYYDINARFYRADTDGMIYDSYSLSNCQILGSRDIAGDTYEKEYSTSGLPKELSYYAIVNLLSLDHNLYQYRKSLCTYSTGDPFAEATMTFSNISGGLGIFGAYNVYSLRVESE